MTLFLRSRPRSYSRFERNGLLVVNAGAFVLFFVGTMLGMSHVDRDRLAPAARLARRAEGADRVSQEFASRVGRIAH